VQGRGFNHVKQNSPVKGPLPALILYIMNGNFGDKRKTAGGQHSVRTYNIKYNRRKKRWQLNKGISPIFSAKKKEDVEWWYKEVIAKNCVIF
jgi:hypothetical protein